MESNDKVTVTRTFTMTELFTPKRNIKTDHHLKRSDCYSNCNIVMFKKLYVSYTRGAIQHLKQHFLSFGL